MRFPIFLGCMRTQQEMVRMLKDKENGMWREEGGSKTPLIGWMMHSKDNAGRPCSERELKHESNPATSDEAAAQSASVIEKDK